MISSTAAVLFESTDAPSVLTDPANEDWVTVLKALEGEQYDILERRYYVALHHFRQRSRRAALPGQIRLAAGDKQEAKQNMLNLMIERKENSKSHQAGDSDTFVDPYAGSADDSLPEALRDFSKRPPSLRALRDGPGRPPCDAQCLMRAFLAAPWLGVRDSPRGVHGLLRSNPTFARLCGFMGGHAMKQLGELTSRRLPSLSTCEEFSEVMTRYGLWHLARMQQVRENLQSGVVGATDTLMFDTTHIKAHSHCDHVVPIDATKSGKKPKHRKVPRMRKNCDCGKEQWDSCAHPWTPTDQGAGVVVKGPTRIYWAHKISVAALADTEIPIDVRTLNYAAENDGKTLAPHLEHLQRDLPDVTQELRYVLADDSYQGNQEELDRLGLGARLVVPVHPDSKSKAQIAAGFKGVDRFTPIGVPVCQAGHRFEMRGRDISHERYIWAAPDDGEGHSVCMGCPLAGTCLNKGTRRHIRVERADFPRINWDHPQHLTRNISRYQKRTGVERAIKRLKVDLCAEHLTHRDGLRVQAHLDRKLFTLHLLLKATASTS